MCVRMIQNEATYYKLFKGQLLNTKLGSSSTPSVPFHLSLISLLYILYAFNKRIKRNKTRTFFSLYEM